MPNSRSQVIHGLAEHVSADNAIGGAAEIVVAEPYYEILEGWHIQEALNYFYTVRSLVKRGVVSPAALSVPAYANVMACVVEFDDFFSAYGKVGVDDRVSGFRHSAVNYYGDRYPHLRRVASTVAAVDTNEYPKAFALPKCHAKARPRQ